MADGLRILLLGIYFHLPDLKKRKDARMNVEGLKFLTPLPEEIQINLKDPKPYVADLRFEFFDGDDD